jgi:hypothetical protein
MATMYDLTSDYLAVLDMANNPDIPAEVITDTLEGISGEIEIKAENIAKVIKELEAEISKLQSEEKRLSSRRKTIENNIKSTKEYLYNAMKITGKEKFKTELFSFNVQKNPVKLVIDDESKIPCKYLIEQAPTVDKAGLKEYLKSLTTDKAVHYAHLEQSEGVRIR